MKILRPIISGLFVLAVLLSAPACNNPKSYNNNKEMEENKVLVAFFSATGTTEKAARRLAAVMNADIYEIKPAVAYTEADLDWRDSLSRSSLEMKDKSSRPALADTITDLSAYDIVFIGFPIWWYTAPTIINSFIENQNFEGKTIVTFATSGSSPIDPATSDLKAKYPDLNFKPGKLMNNISDDDLKAWKSELVK